MTAQISENLVYRNTGYALFTEPLEEWFRQCGRRPPFALRLTACWRGYLGSWEITDDRLYLVDLEGTMQSGEEANLQTVFPDQVGPVFAEWFSGDLRCPTGPLVEYVHQGFQSRYASELVLRVEKGGVASVMSNSNHA